MIVDCVIPARDEADTVAEVVRAARACKYVRTVIVVDDGSTDATASEAAGAGALVVRRTSDGSKAHAMQDGVARSDADVLLFADADLVGITAEHLDAIVEPVLARRAALSIGTFDYRPWNWFVLRFPPTTGERCMPRWVFDAVPAHKRNGYTIEIMINEVIAEGRLPTVARVMRGVTHRTKRDKFGKFEGYRRTWRMFFELLGLPVRGVVRWRTYWFYLRALTVE
ncbi:MAG TPA: glycosyltransferase [Acidimicrobiales bacterium]|nr:glycosyltransferase [Acidimicrobiales bacterium]